jgi:hypothetical protein
LLEVLAELKRPQVANLLMGVYHVGVGWVIYWIRPRLISHDIHILRVLGLVESEWDALNAY